jgi:diguanylate cyclase (GGDEF)-like protein
MATGAIQIRLASIARAPDRLARMRPAHAWLLVLLCMDLAGLGDLATGPALWFGPAYLFVVCLAAWSLGWVAGQSVGVGCLVLTLAINGLALYPYGLAEFAWNLGSRFFGASIMIAVVAAVRRAYLRQWWLARTDALTGALNRQAFFELGGTLAGTCCWRALLYADLDGLKAINDGKGHAAGDGCLRTYAATVRRIIRRDDMFARVGGDEFLVFMPVKDEAAGRSVAARLHAAMNAIPGAGGQHLKSSVGTIVVPPGRLSIDELVRRADNLMYQAKQRGACHELAVATDVSAASGRGRARSLSRGPAIVPVQERKRGPERRSAGGGASR